MQVPQVSNLPVEVMARYREVTLCADIMFINNVPYLITVSRNLRFGTTMKLENKSGKTVMQELLRVLQVYRGGGFTVTVVATDQEFNYMRGELAENGAMLNETSADEHVGEIERFIHTMKERICATYNSLPFERLPTRLVTEMVNSAVFWWNSFPGNSAISDCLSPSEIVLRRGLDYQKHCQLEFGEYVQTHEATGNSMAPRTVGALALRPSGNAQGGHLFYSLSTGKVLHRNHWTVLPMPQEVIDCITVLASTAPTGLTFIDRLQEIMGDDPLVLEYFAGGGHDNLVADPAHEPQDGEDNNEGMDDENVDFGDGNHDSDLTDDGDFGHGDSDQTDDDGSIGAEYETDGDLSAEDIEAAADPEPGMEEPAEAQQDMQQELKGEFNKRYGECSGRYELRPRRRVTYTHLNATASEPGENPRSDSILEPGGNPRSDNTIGETENRDPQEEALLGFVFMQVSMKRGLRMFGGHGEEAVEAELQQLHDQCVIEPVKAESLSAEEKHKALGYLMFLKEKRTGKIKGCGCADCRKQRLYTTKQEAMSPTVAIESILLSCVIDAEEGRHIATVDVPGALMQADMDETIHMKLEGTMVHLLLNVVPHFTEYVVTERGRKVLYMLLAKALYGMIHTALLFYRKLAETLVSWGFAINPYDPCVANKMIDGKQCTVMWHVDDLKISHVWLSVVKDVIGKLKKVFGSEAPLTEWIGKVHDYLGMRIDYSAPGKVSISQRDYLEEILGELPKDMDGLATSPAAAHLFEVSSAPDLLPVEAAEMFHCNVAKLLFVSQRSRPDIQTAVAFLSTRVKAPDRDDYKNLRRVMQYLRGSLDLTRTMEADGTGIARWWIDASFAVHPSMRGHTGGVLTLGKGAAYMTSKGQKISTRSSTKSELVGVYDVLPQVLWTQHFLEAQGYSVKDCVIYQDNMSTILLAENGKASSSKRTRHINIRYFFVIDLVKKGQVKVTHCPTEDMVSDYFTKPLQGSAFRKL
jgi:hypothetical protein